MGEGKGEEEGKGGERERVRVRENTRACVRKHAHSPSNPRQLGTPTHARAHTQSEGGGKEDREGGRRGR